jgi:uncharacterized C2H2 Zn-finger protein
MSEAEEMEQCTCPECGAMFDTYNVDRVECPRCGAIFEPTKEEKERP